MVLLSRNPDNYNPAVAEIQKNGGKALGVSTDLTSASSISNMLEKVKAEFGTDLSAKVAVFNANSAFARKPFLEIEEEEWDKGYTGSMCVDAASEHCRSQVISTDCSLQ